MEVPEYGYGRCVLRVATSFAIVLLQSRPRAVRALGRVYDGDKPRDDGTAGLLPTS